MKRIIKILFVCFIFVCITGCYNYDITGLEIENDGNENNSDNEIDKNAKVFLHTYGTIYLTPTPTVIIISPNDNIHFYDGSKKMNIQSIQKISDSEYNLTLEYYYNGNIIISDKYLYLTVGYVTVNYIRDEIN